MGLLRHLHRAQSLILLEAPKFVDFFVTYSKAHLKIQTTFLAWLKDAYKFKQHFT